MKNLSKLLACFFVLGIVGNSCSDIEDINDNPRDITQEQLEVDFQHVGSKYKPMHTCLVLSITAKPKCRCIFWLYD